MPKKISATEAKTRAELSNLHHVITADPASYEIYRVAASEFRGASVFVSTNAPSTTPEDSTISSYIDGDIFLHETSEGHVLYVWDNTNNVWNEKEKLNGSRVLSATDFPSEVLLDQRTTNFLDNGAYEGDYYLNKTYNLLYGPYSATNGFLFENRTLQGYESFRRPETFEIEVSDAAAYDDLGASLQAHVTALTGVNDVEAIRVQRPVTADVYHLKRADDTGHGGYYYTVNSALATNNDPSFYVNLTDAVSGATKQHFREATTFNLDTAPVQDDTKYREGDNVLDVSRGVLYYGYNEGIAATTDLGLVFDGQTTLAGSSLKTSQDGGGNWIDPTANDSEYADGDYILTKNKGTSRIHGPYKSGAGTDFDAWPLYAVLRGPISHDYNFDDTNPYLPTDYTGDYPVHGTSGDMIVDGDIARIVYSSKKIYKLEEGVAVGYGSTAPEKTLTWGTTRVNVHSFRWTQSPGVSAPSDDNDSYYDGEVVRNANGDLFKWVEDFTTPANSTFEQLEGLRANVTHSIPSSTATSYPHILSTDATGHADWGGSTVQDGDTLEVHYSAEKVVVFTANVNEATNTVTWENEYYKFGARTVLGADRTEPTANNLIYRTDDLYLTSDFGLYSYDDSGSGAWTFERVDRPTETFRRDGLLNNFDPTVGFTETKPCSMFVEAADERFVKVGDIFISKLQSTVTDKEIAYVVTKADYADGAGGVVVDRFNPRGTVYHSTNAAGRPNYSDKDYAEGDFIDSSATGWRYGPYVEGQSTDLAAWPDFIQLKESTEITDTTLTTTHELKADDGLFFFEEL